MTTIITDDLHLPNGKVITPVNVKSIEIKTVNSQSLLPYVLQDKHNLALENCMKEAFKVDLKKLLLCPVENVDETLLPILAKEGHIMGYEGWNLAKTNEQKQNLIKNSVQLHAKKGSMPTLKEALQTLNIEAEIKEWDEYNGRIGHFRVEFLNIYDRGLDDNFEAEIKEMIKNYKPLTRILDVINYFLCSKAKVYVGARLKTLETTAIKTKKVQI